MKSTDNGCLKVNFGEVGLDNIYIERFWKTLKYETSICIATIHKKAPARTIKVFQIL